MGITVSPCRVNTSVTSAVRSAAATTAMPMPQLKVRVISSAWMSPVLASQVKTSGGVQDVASISAQRDAGRTRGIFSTSPPPVIWANALTPPPMAARQLFT